MKRRRASIRTWTNVFGLALVVSCSRPTVVEVRGTAMGTTYSVKFVGGVSDREAVGGAVDAELATLNAVYSTYLDGSVVSRFNASRDIEVVHDLGEDFVSLVRLAIRVAEATDGAFDPTVMPLVQAYPVRVAGQGQATRPRSLPSDRAVADAVAKVGYQHLEIVAPDKLRKLRPDLELDTNGFAKGHGVDRVAALLLLLGFPDHLVEIGGEVRCAGTKLGGREWRIGVERPTDDGRRAVVEAVPVHDAAIATSGGYRQYVDTATGKRIHHIFDPATGANPTVSVVSVSVRAPTCALADALATAFMVTGPERAMRILTSMRPAFGEDLGALFLLDRSDCDGADAAMPTAPRYERVEVAW